MATAELAIRFWPLPLSLKLNKLKLISTGDGVIPVDLGG